MFSRAALRSSRGFSGFRLFSSRAKVKSSNIFKCGAAFTGIATAGSLALSQMESSKAKDVNYDEVRDVISELLNSNDDYDDGSFGPLLIRLAWHASGTYNKHDQSGGSNGATMRFAPESEHGANAGLHVARNILESVKRQFPEISYSDLWTLAGVVAVEEMGGPKINWFPGRIDKASEKDCTPDGRLPDAALGNDHLRDIFHRMGFNDKEIVALSGAHTFGRCHTNRSGFWGPWTRAPTTFSNLYFQELLNNTWTPKRWNGPLQYEDPTGELMMLPTDLALLEDPVFRKQVELYANDEETFAKDFASAYSKLLSLGVPVKNSSWTPFVLVGALLTMASSK